MFYVLEFEIGILVLNTCIDTYCIILCIIVSRRCHSAGSVYNETLCIRKKSPAWCAGGRDATHWKAEAQVQRCRETRFERL